MLMSSFGTRVQRFFHLLDKMLVVIAFWVGRNESMCMRRDSGRSLILSTSSFWHFDLDFSISESQTLNCNIVILFFSEENIVILVDIELMLTSIYKTDTEFVFDRDTRLCV